MIASTMTTETLDDWAARIAPLELVERKFHITSKAEALAGILDDPLARCHAAVEDARERLDAGLLPEPERRNFPDDRSAPHIIPVDEDGVPLADEPPAADAGYALAALDWQALLREGVPDIEYVREPYFPKGARIWVWGATGSYKSLWAEHEGAVLSRNGVRVSYFQEENPIQEELRRLAKLQPDPAYFRLFHRSGMDLLDERWVDALLRTTRGDEIVFLDSLTDLWGGDEGDNRAVQMFDAAVLKPLQRQGVTPVVLHHTGHKQMFSDRGGATAGRGASSLGQKADVVLEFKSSGEDLFTIVYGKCRIGGIHHPERSFRVEDTDDGTVVIVETVSPEERAAEQLAEMAAQAVLTAPRGYLTTNELRVAIGGGKSHQTAALALLGADSRVHAGAEKVQTKDGRFRDSKVWRPAGGVLEEGFDFSADGGGKWDNPSPLRVEDRFPT